MKRIQYYITPSDGKKLIAKGIAALPDVKSALAERKVLIVAGTTNAYVARELLLTIGDAEGFDALGYYRGVTLPRGAHVAKHEFIGDVLIENGKWVRGLDVFEAAGKLDTGDIVFKGGNAVNLCDREAAVLIGHPQCGTAIPTICAGVGRRVKFYIPIGLEKRVTERISRLAALCNAPEAQGPRLLPLPGEIFTELDAIAALTGAKAELLASGGICGAEGGCYLLCEGEPEQLDKLAQIMDDIAQIEDFPY